MKFIYFFIPLALVIAASAQLNQPAPGADERSEESHSPQLQAPSTPTSVSNGHEASHAKRSTDVVVPHSTDAAFPTDIIDDASNHKGTHATDPVSIYDDQPKAVLGSQRNHPDDVVSEIELSRLGDERRSPDHPDAFIKTSHIGSATMDPDNN